MNVKLTMPLAVLLALGNGFVWGSEQEQVNQAGKDIYTLLRSCEKATLQENAIPKDKEYGLPNSGKEKTPEIVEINLISDSEDEEIKKVDKGTQTEESMRDFFNNELALQKECAHHKAMQQITHQANDSAITPLQTQPNTTRVNLSIKSFFTHPWTILIFKSCIAFRLAIEGGRYGAYLQDHLFKYSTRNNISGPIAGIATTLYGIKIMHRIIRDLIKLRSAQPSINKEKALIECPRKNPNDTINYAKTLYDHSINILFINSLISAGIYFITCDSDKLVESPIFSLSALWMPMILGCLKSCE